jgi:hypothetical protein
MRRSQFHSPLWPRWAFGVAAPTASAGDFDCVGTPAVPPNTDGRVPPGASCRLLNQNVTGNVKGLENSRLYINGTDVSHNVIGDEADVVQLVGKTNVGAVPADQNNIRENIEIKDGDNSAAGGSTKVAVCSTRVIEGTSTSRRWGRRRRRRGSWSGVPVPSGRW